MRDQQLWEERVVPALNDMYSQGLNIFDSDRQFSWDDIMNYAPRINEQRMTPIYAFYMDKESQDKIIKKATRYLRKYWRWPYRTEWVMSEDVMDEIREKARELENKPNLSEEEQQELTKCHHDIEWNEEAKRRNNLWNEYWSKLQDLQGEYDSQMISKKEFNAKYDELCKNYNMTKRSADAEKVEFELMDYSPCLFDKTFEESKKHYQELVQALGKNDEQDVEKVIQAAESIFGKKNPDVVVSYMFYSNILNENKTIRAW